MKAVLRRDPEEEFVLQGTDEEKVGKATQPQHSIKRNVLFVVPRRTGWDHAPFAPPLFPIPFPPTIINVNFSLEKFTTRIKNE